MILGNFRLGGEIQEVVVDGNSLMFKDQASQTITTIDGIKLSKAGVLKEFPDLKDDVEWHTKAKERFKTYFKKLKTEKERMEYVKEELIKYGYEPLFFQRAGHRPKKWRNN